MVAPGVQDIAVPSSFFEPAVGSWGKVGGEIAPSEAQDHAGAHVWEREHARAPIWRLGEAAYGARPFERESELGAPAPLTETPRAQGPRSEQSARAARAVDGAVVGRAASVRELPPRRSLNLYTSEEHARADPEPAPRRPSRAQCPLKHPYFVIIG